MGWKSLEYDVQAQRAGSSPSPRRRLGFIAFGEFELIANSKKVKKLENDAQKIGS
jgi:hypothetical protein